VKLTRTLIDLGLSAVAGYVGTKAMEPVSMKLYEFEPTAARAREDAARPGGPRTGSRPRRSPGLSASS
jgi:hypothetical protein